MTKSQPSRPTSDRREQSFHLRLIERDHPDRQKLDDYVYTIFDRNFGARPHHLFPWIAELRDQDHIRIGALGLRWGSSSDFFSEVYLDEPAECAIARHFRRPLERGQVLEVGHFASSCAGAGRAIITAMAALTARLPVSWILSTLNRPMRRSFGRAGVPLVELAEARPEQMGASARYWGRYYQSQPKVMAVDLDMARRTFYVAGNRARIHLDLSGINQAGADA